MDSDYNASKHMDGLHFDYIDFLYFDSIQLRSGIFEVYIDAFLHLCLSDAVVAPPSRPAPKAGKASADPKTKSIAAKVEENVCKSYVLIDVGLENN